MASLSEKLAQLSQQDSITSIFKMQSLNTALKFVKDDTRLSLDYKDLTPKQADFIKILIDCTNVDSDVGFGYKSLYAPLWEALKIFGMKYEFQLSILTGQDGKKRAHLKKIPKQLVKEKLPMSGDLSCQSIKQYDDFIPSLESSDLRHSLRKEEMAKPAQPRMKHELEQPKKESLPGSVFLRLGPYSSGQKETEDSNEALESVPDNKNPPDLIMGHKAKGLQKSILYLNNLSKIFVKSSLDKLYHFYKDEAQASILFKGVNQYEAYYLVTFKNLLNSEALQASFDKNIRGLMAEVKAVVPNKSNFSIKVKVVNKYPGEISDIIFIKTPVYDNEAHDMWVETITRKSGHKRDSSTKRESSKSSDIKSDLSTVKTPTKSLVSLSSNQEDKSSSKKDSSDENRTISKTHAPLSVMSNSSPSLVKSRRSLSTDRRIKSIAFQPGGVMDLEKPKTPDNEPPVQADGDKNPAENTVVDSKGKVRGLSNRAAKLIEGMSVPVKCDKAIKMMQGMGWEGGALGMRKEGIVEPLMPALTIVSGAGLGHEGDPKKGKREEKKGSLGGDPQLRYRIMQTIVDLICSQEQIETLEFPPPINPAITRFVKSVVTKLGLRCDRSWKEDIAELAEKALVKMRAIPNMFINTYMPPNDRTIELRKIYVNPNSKVQQKDVVALNRTVTFEKMLEAEFPVGLDQILDNLAPYCTKKKSNSFMLFKLSNLLRILEFVRSKNMSAVIPFQSTISKEYKQYLDLAIQTVNSGALVGDTLAEHGLSAFIYTVKGNWDLTVDYKYNLSECTVRKIYGPENPESPTGSTTMVVAKSNTENNVSAKEINNKIKITKTDLDLIKNEQIAKKTKDEQVSNSDAERTKRETTSDDENAVKKIKTDIHRVRFVPIGYPDKQIGNSQVQSVQKLISSAIDTSAELPLLKCGGVENGALLYNCHDENSYVWLRKTFSDMNDIMILDVNDSCTTYKLTIKFNCFFDCKEPYLFDKLERYNRGLSTSKWVVQQRCNFGDHLTFLVDVDEDSYIYISECGFYLYAGVDVAQFTVNRD